MTMYVTRARFIQGIDRRLSNDASRWWRGIRILGHELKSSAALFHRYQCITEHQADPGALSISVYFFWFVLKVNSLFF